jgi:hypothetical protein
LREGFVRSMSRRKQDDTKNTKGIQRQEDATAELGNASVTATSRLTLCVRSANEMGSSLPQKKFITSFLCPKVEQINKKT